MPETKLCCLCGAPLEIKRTPAGEVYWRDGNNAQPLAEGRCCDACNDTRVLPERIRRLMMREAN